MDNHNKLLDALTAEMSAHSGVTAGSRHGRWTVLEYSHSVRRKDRRRRMVHFWSCRCDCGTERAVEQGKLSQGETKSCGCYRREVLSVARTRPEERLKPGDEFSGMVVLRFDHVKMIATKNQKRDIWMCRCEICGTERPLSRQALKKRKSKPRACDCSRAAKMKLKNREPRKACLPREKRVIPADIPKPRLPAVGNWGPTRKVSCTVEAVGKGWECYG